MPRKVKVRLGIDEVQAVPSFTFTAPTADEILRALGSVDADRNAIIARLVRCASDHLWRSRQYRGRATISEQNAMFAKSRRLADELHETLLNADKDSLWAVLSHPNYCARPQAMDVLKGELERLAETNYDLERKGSARKGPQLEILVHRTVQVLARLWVEWTGEPFTHNPRYLTEYKGDPRSRAGKFVVAFFCAVDPSVSVTTIAGAMASVVKGRRLAQQSKKSCPREVQTF